MQDYNTIIGAIQMRLNKCPTRSVMDLQITLKQNASSATAERLFHF